MSSDSAPCPLSVSPSRAAITDSLRTRRAPVTVNVVVRSPRFTILATVRTDTPSMAAASARVQVAGGSLVVVMVALPFAVMMAHSLPGEGDTRGTGDRWHGSRPTTAA